ncbi:hypothetical protein IEQ34_009590 [Dendrobium chrysotoxum]|uniref:Uncharacterized protein n=1 Tax=Dendrobium chrysotoxum TaxID=161865 RepID=A0AAV7GJI1_DENCH|nr:hypothetical protein IEQ34_009590 [Dendrobium chrysotoxum]
MDSDSWSRISAASKRHQSTLQSRYADQYLGFEEMEGDEDEWRPEFPCPLCDEDFDIVGLCSHIDDDHPFEAKNGHKRRLRKGSSGSHGALNFLRKEVRDGSLQSLLGGSSRLITPSHAAPDPLLSSFISNVPIADSSRIVEPEPLDEGINKISEEKMVESFFTASQRTAFLQLLKAIF